MSLQISPCPPEHDDNAGYGTVLSNREKAPIGGIYIADGFKEREIPMEECFDVRFGTVRCEVIAGKVRSILTRGAPIYEAMADGRTQVAHDMLCCLEVDRARVIRELTENQHCGCYVETPDLDCKTEHASERTLFKAVLENDD
jgi:hypothetical protein